MEDWYAETRTWRKWSFPDFVVPNAFMLMGLLEAGDLDGALYVAGQLMTDTEAVADALTVGHCLSVLFDARLARRKGLAELRTRLFAE